MFTITQSRELIEKRKERRITKGIVSDKERNTRQRKGKSKEKKEKNNNYVKEKKWHEKETLSN